MKTKNIVLTLFLVMSVGVGVGAAQVVAEEPAVGSVRDAPATRRLKSGAGERTSQVREERRDDRQEGARGTSG